MRENPKCLTERQFEDWIQIALASKEPVTICRICAPEYQDSMIESDKCETVKWSSIVFMESQGDGSL